MGTATAGFDRARDENAGRRIACTAATSFRSPPATKLSPHGLYETAGSVGLRWPYLEKALC